MLDWIVLEPQSPSNPTTEGCERQYVNTDHRELVVTCTATSAGGTTTVSTEAIQYDATVPTVHGQVETPGIDVAGTTWYGQIPSIAWSAEDATSGVAVGSIHSVLTIVDEGRNQGARAVASDVAGNASGTTLRPFNVDLSAPLVEAHLTSTPAFDDGTTAWFKDEATVEVAASDPNLRGTTQRGLGLATPALSTHVVTETTDFTATATDNVGHVGTSNTVPVHVDSADPVVTATCPSISIPQGPAGQREVDRHGRGLRPGDRGVRHCPARHLQGRPPHLHGPGATDRVGHVSAPATCEYRVVYAFVGFFEPIDNFGVFNKVKAGSAVPVKFSLLGNQGMNILSGAPTATKVACPTTMKSDSLQQTAGLRGHDERPQVRPEDQPVQLHLEYPRELRRDLPEADGQPGRRHVVHGTVHLHQVVAAHLTTTSADGAALVLRSPGRAVPRCPTCTVPGGSLTDDPARSRRTSAHAATPRPGRSPAWDH